jgi:hypothetical protein
VRASAAVLLSLLFVVLAKAEPASAGPGLLVGVDDDRIKWTSRPTPILGAVRTLGLDAMRVTIEWRPGRRHLTRRDHTAIMRALSAHKRGVRVVLAVYGRADEAPAGRRAREDYCRFVRNTLRRYSEVKDVVVWNEANSDTFWRPREDAPAAYSALLARCWDLLHEAVPDVNVITTTAASHEPAAFIRGVGAAYRASGRKRPLFDTAGHNPYPLTPDEPPTARHEVYIGQGDYDRFVAVLDESFVGTPQPAAPVWYLEHGFQTSVEGMRRSSYEGRETVTGTITPAEQAEQLAGALVLAYCQPRVTAFFNFLLVDEPSLEGWQSGLLWADWKRKPAFAAYRDAIGDLRRDAVECGAPTKRAEPRTELALTGPRAPRASAGCGLAPRSDVPARLRARAASPARRRASPSSRRARRRTP